jgi:hypothetical protein
MRYNMKNYIVVGVTFLLVACGGGSPDQESTSSFFSASSVRHARVAPPTAVLGERRAYNIFWKDNALVGTSQSSALADFRLTEPQVRLQDISLTFDIDGVSGQLYRLYQAAFGRTPDVKGFGYWKDAVEKNGLTMRDVADTFIKSPESTALYGSSIDDGAFIAHLYQNILHRTGDPDGVSYWANVLKSGAQRAEVLQAFAGSPENRAATAATTAKGMPFAEPGISYIPVSNAQGPKDVPIGTTIDFDGSISTDANDDKLNFNWSLTGKPPGSTTAFTSPTVPKPSLKFDVPGTYQVTLWTNDGHANSYSPAQLSVIAHGIVADSGIYTCSGIDSSAAASLYSMGHTYLDRDKDGKPCTAADVAFERSPPVPSVPDTGIYKCASISHEYAVLLYLQGHTYLDRDHDGKPCEANDLTVEKNTYVPPSPVPSSGMCWVNGYTRSNGTRVSGYWRRC